jgi:hypothetical protein
MGFAHSRRAVDETTAPLDRALLFKEDRPRRIDQYISFFGTEDSDASADACGEELLDALNSEHWAQQ